VTYFRTSSVVRLAHKNHLQWLLNSSKASGGPSAKGRKYERREGATLCISTV
jgi:hypothetical protein